MPSANTSRNSAIPAERSAQLPLPISVESAPNVPTSCLIRSAQGTSWLGIQSPFSVRNLTSWYRRLIPELDLCLAVCVLAEEMTKRGVFVSITTNSETF